MGLAGLAAGAPAAFAGKSQTIHTKRGHVEFHHEGEGLLALDTRRDGYSLSAELASPEGLPLFDVVDRIPDDAEVPVRALFSVPDPR